MNEFAEKKKQAAPLMAEPAEKKKLPHQVSSSLSEGLMTTEGAKIEAAGLASNRKSVQIELASILARQKKKAPAKKAVRKWDKKIKEDSQKD